MEPWHQWPHHWKWFHHCWWNISWVNHRFFDSFQQIHQSQVWKVALFLQLFLVFGCLVAGLIPSILECMHEICYVNLFQAILVYFCLDLAWKLKKRKTTFQSAMTLFVLQRIELITLEICNISPQYHHLAWLVNLEFECPLWKCLLVCLWCKPKMINWNNHLLFWITFNVSLLFQVCKLQFES